MNPYGQSISLILLATFGILINGTDAWARTRHHRATNEDSESAGAGPLGNGKASFYETGSYLYSAAHRTLPFGTIVSVTNRLNHKSVAVVINDRGPFIHGRVIDLSESAATYLDMITLGVVPVDLKRVDEKSYGTRPSEPGSWCVSSPGSSPYVRLSPFPD